MQTYVTLLYFLVEDPKYCNRLRNMLMLTVIVSLGQDFKAQVKEKYYAFNIMLLFSGSLCYFGLTLV